MKLRLHEIELGTEDVEGSSFFYQEMLGASPRLEQKGLVVLNAGIDGFDFNFSTHLSPGRVMLSFLTDDLAAVEKRLQGAGVAYEGPAEGHLGMVSISFQDGNGYFVKVNMPGKDSPSWLAASL